MKISVLILHLEQIRQDAGDLDVERYSIGGERIKQPKPMIAWRKKLTPRQKRDDFVFIGDKESVKGEMVCKL